MIYRVLAKEIYIELIKLLIRKLLNYKISPINIYLCIEKCRVGGDTPLDIFFRSN